MDPQRDRTVDPHHRPSDPDRVRYLRKRSDVLYHAENVSEETLGVFLHGGARLDRHRYVKQKSGKVLLL